MYYTSFYFSRADSIARGGVLWYNTLKQEKGVLFMENGFSLTPIIRPSVPRDAASAFGPIASEEVRAFHKSFPGYGKTPLVRLTSLAEKIGVSALYIKDESFRFGLNAFKALGGSFAIGKWISDKLGIPIKELPYERMVSDEIREKLGCPTFITATDGNHGRGVAWTARMLGCRCIVFMPKGSAQERLCNIRALGADAEILDCNYDECVRRAARLADENGYVLVQDTAWEGYEEIPKNIMRGYTTMGAEIVEQLNSDKPTHIFLQAGVGAMAGAMTGYFASYYGENRPKIIIVEPNKANCIYLTAKADDGERHFVTDNMNTIMAGLACGEPCTIGWEVLRNHADYCASIPEYAAADAMRALGKPIGNDQRVISGESGAAGFGFALALLTDPALLYMKETLKLDSSSRILCISTEGATDEQNYNDIVLRGAYSRGE